MADYFVPLHDVCRRNITLCVRVYGLVADCFVQLHDVGRRNVTSLVNIVGECVTKTGYVLFIRTIIFW